MSTIRNRTKQHLPTVLLTLLSIIQAFALELLWTHLTETDYLFDRSWSSVLYWLQLSASFLGIVLIWVVYASSAMRFRWVPKTSDSVFPFLVGLLEFSLIEMLGPDKFGPWVINVALLFGLMTWIDHSIMRRARRDNENDVFFKRFQPAKLRDFYPAISIFIVLAVLGTYLSLNSGAKVVAAISVLGINGVVGWLLLKASQYWDRSLVNEHDAEQP